MGKIICDNKVLSLSCLLDEGKTIFKELLKFEWSKIAGNIHNCNSADLNLLNDILCRSQNTTLESVFKGRFKHFQMDDPVK